MRFGWVAALAGTMLLSGCELFLDGFGFEVFDRNKAEVTLPAEPADL